MPPPKKKKRPFLDLIGDMGVDLLSRTFGKALEDFQQKAVRAVIATAVAVACYVTAIILLGVAALEVLSLLEVYRPVALVGTAAILLIAGIVFHTRAGEE